jgi:hypothetical protein
LLFLLRNRLLFRVALPINDCDAALDIRLIPAGLDGLIDVGRYLPSHNGTYETHQPFRFAKVTFLNCLYNYEKSVMHAIVQFLRPQVATKVIADTATELAIQKFETGVFSGFDLRDEGGPIYARPVADRHCGILRVVFGWLNSVRGTL